MLHFLYPPRGLARIRSYSDSRSPLARTLPRRCLLISKDAAISAAPLRQSSRHELRNSSSQRASASSCCHLNVSSPERFPGQGIWTIVLLVVTTVFPLLVVVVVVVRVAEQVAVVVLVEELFLFRSP